MSSGAIAGKAYVLLQLRDKVSQGLKTMEKKFRDFGTSVSLTSGIAFAGSAAVMSWPLKLAGDMEQTTTSFKVFLGDAEKAKKMVQTLDQISVETPYELADLAESARLMMASGLEDTQIPDMLKMVGDIAQGDAQQLFLLSKAFADAAQNGKLMAQENNQFRNSGFNVLMVLAEQQVKKLGGTVEDYMPALRKRMEEGTISVWEIAESMKIATSEGGRFHGMQIEQAQTFKGLMSTLWDYINRGIRKFGEAMLPAAKVFIRFGMGIADAVGKLIEYFGTFFQYVGLGLMGFVALTAVGTVVGGAILAISFAFGALASIVGVLFTGAFLTAIKLMIIGGAAIWAIVSLVRAYAAEISAFANYLYVIFRPAINAILGVWSVAVMMVQGIAAALTQGNFQQAWDILVLGIEAGFYYVLTLLEFVASTIVDVIAAAFPIFGQLLAYASDSVTGIYDAILGGRIDLAWAIVWNKIETLWETGIFVLKGAWYSYVMFIQLTISQIKWAFLSVGNVMMLAFQTAFYGIQLAAFNVAKAIEKALQAVGQGEMVAGLADQIKPAKDLNGILDERKKIQDQINKELEKERLGAAIDAGVNMGGAAKRLNELQQIEQGLNEEAANAKKAGGANTLAERAALARKELEAAMKAAQRPALDPKDTKNPINKAQNALSQDELMGKFMKANARGTYSAAAAMLLGREANDYEKETANNTKKTADALQNMNLTFAD
jgi:hypothetical protein